MNDQLPINIQVDNLDNIIKYLPVTLLSNTFGPELIIKDQVFENCECNGVRFNDILFKNCRFNNCSFQCSNFKGVEFRSCTFNYTNIHYSYLEQTTFIKCQGSFVGSHSQLLGVTFDECDLSEFYFRQLTFNGCNIFSPTKLNWDCPELIAQMIYEESKYEYIGQQVRDLIAIIESSGRCHNRLKSYQHFARKQVLQALAKYIKNENDLDVPQYLRDELILIEKGI